ncbi:hypothetical protein ACFQ7N_02950 [Streptomyces niveus]|uniref:hypothetical protein n=1 Tax=Streptomyces niveus TaxID=193462 RepID=UPI0036C32D54
MDMTNGPPSAVTHARALWTELAGVPVEFTSPTDVVVAPGSLLCPPGWSGIVRVGDAAVVTAPDVRSADALGEAARILSYGELTDPVRLGVTLSGTTPVLDVLGPAALCYLDGAGARSCPRPARSSRWRRTTGAR